MSKVEIVTSLATDSLAMIEIQVDDVFLGHVLLDEVELSRQIDHLAEVRAKMADPVPPTLDPGPRLTPTYQPSWWVGRGTNDAGVEGILLALRDPGKGWVAFLLDEEQAREVVKDLWDQLPPL